MDNDKPAPPQREWGVRHPHGAVEGGLWHDEALHLARETDGEVVYRDLPPWTRA